VSSRILQSILFFFLDYNVKWEDHLLIITGFWINIIEGFEEGGMGKLILLSLPQSFIVLEEFY
jgi:hypothetical protein